MLVPFKANHVRNDVKKEKFTLLQINAKWNRANDVKIPQIPNCNIQYAFLEDQKESFRKSVNYVPIVVLYNDNHAVQQWSADISFKLKISREEILNVINRIEK